MGFCIFVLSNYMKTLPEGAHGSRAGRRRLGAADLAEVILPLCRPALAALATLEFTFIYNDFFWALVLMKTGDRRPITSALNNLQGQFFTDFNLLAAAPCSRRSRRSSSSSRSSVSSSVASPWARPRARRGAAPALSPSSGRR